MMAWNSLTNSVLAANHFGNAVNKGIIRLDNRKFYECAG